MQINSRCYFEKDTLNIICFTNEFEGDYEKAPTKEDDFSKYSKLVGYDPNKVDFVVLEYGTLERVLIKSSNYYIDPNTKALIVEYNSDGVDDIVEQPIPLHERIEQLEEENARLIFDSIEKEIIIDQLENDVSDLILTIGGMN